MKAEVAAGEARRPLSSLGEERVAVEGVKTGEYSWDLNSKFAFTGLESVSNMEGAEAEVEDVVGTTQHLMWVG